MQFERTLALLIRRELFNDSCFYNLLLIHFSFFPGSVSRVLSLREEAAFIRLCEENGGWEPPFLRVLCGSGTSLSSDSTWGRAGTSPGPGQPPLSSCPGFPARPCGGSLHGPVSPLSLPPSAGVYVIRCESLQIPPLCVIWAGRSILPPPARRNNGEPPGLPRIIRNSNRHERDLPSRRKTLQF